METKTFKVTVDGKERTLHFRNPTQAELLSMDMEYRKIYSVCLREGIISEAEARKIAAQRNVWNDEDDKEITQLSIEIGILEQIVDAATEGTSDKDEATIVEAVNKISSLRAKLMGKIQTKVEIISQSAEGLANQQRMHKFTELCCIEGDKRFFDSNAAYVVFASTHSEVLSEIFKQAYFTEYGDPSRMSDNWAEVKYLKKKVEQKAAEAEKAREAEVANKERSPEALPVDAQSKANTKEP